MAGDAVTVFFSYSHKDEALRDELANHLKILKLEGAITDWHDRQILPGDEWDREIKESLNSAQIILLLISSDFIASQYCWDIEITRAMERHEAGEACVIPVILRSCMWSSAPFGRLQALPKNAAPVTSTKDWPTKDDAFTNVAEGIKKAANDVRQQIQAAKRAKLDQYEVAYRQAIQQEYPLSESTQGKINRLQSALGLSDAEIAPIVTRLSAQYGEGRQKLDQYRREVRLCLEEDGGKISSFSRSILSGFRNTFGLTPEEANAVEQEELKPYRAKANAIEQYKTVFAEALEHESEISEGTRRRLQRFQQTLGLSDGEVEAIEAPLVQAEYASNLSQYQQEFAKAVETKYPLSQRVLELLKTLQQQLDLKDEDVTTIEQPIRDAAETKYQQYLRDQEDAERKRQAEEAKHHQEQLRAREEAEARKQAEAQQQQGFPVRSTEIETVIVTGVQKGGVLGLGQRQVLTQRRRRQVSVFTEDLGGGVGLDMVAIPAGEYLMGTANSERDTIIRERTRHGTSQEDAEKLTGWEMPQHGVKVPDFFMGRHLVTQEQWSQVASLPKVERDLDADPSHFKGAKRPVEKVSWEEAVEFCLRLSRQTGKLYRLPTEAEWEYACRAGTTTPFYFGPTITADWVNCDGNYPYGEAPKSEYREQTTEVGSFPPNRFGLYDMHGNVWEWCQDPWHENYQGAPVDGSVWTANANNDYRVLRGGSWFYAPAACRSALRDGVAPGAHDSNVGFRVVFVSA